jgi:molybdopterin synthase catalytic subunit
MRVNVRFFAVVRERLGRDQESVEISDGSSVNALMEELANREGSLRPLLRYLRVAVNREMVADTHQLRDGDEVALIPPVAGGSDCLRVSSEPLVADEAVRAVAGEGMGGIATFLGIVRRQSAGRTVSRLHYEAYAEMAEAEFRRIADEAARRWPGVRVAILHRTGMLAVGDTAVVVAAAAPHRAEAFSACRFAIDALKERAPIWKKEIGTDGEVWIGIGP